MKNMKNKYLYTTCLALVLFMSSCYKEFLEIVPQDRLTADNYFKNEAELRAATASMYGMPWFDFNDKFFWCAGDLMAGDVLHTWDQEGQFFYFSHNEGNAHISSGWRSLFRVISYANSIINDMPRAAEGKISAEAINKGLAEARFMRATAYFILAEYWGDVPIVENSTELVSSNNMMLPKNTKQSVFRFILRDLEFAAQNLPTSDTPGRVTQWSAKGMLAKAHLTMASNLADGNSAQNFSKAKEYAADVINNSGLSLLANYADLFKIEYNNNQESLFAMQWMGGAYGIGNSRQANWGRNSVVTGNTEAWGGFKSASYDFVKRIENGDRRRSAIFMSLGDFYPEINKEAGGYRYNIVTRDPAKPEQVLENAAPVLNNLKKYVVGRSADNPGGTVTTGQAVGLNAYLLRLADVYLIYVEAAMGSANSTSDPFALGYFNAIRTRAGLANKTSVTFSELIQERRIEFGMESINWFDVKRYYYRNPTAALAYLNSQERGHTYRRRQGNNVPGENTVEGYELFPPDVVTVVKDDNMFMPIPAAEVVANPKLAKGVPAEDYAF
jgi:starch-binding outer membrane protein, SusD/RagB family